MNREAIQEVLDDCLLTDEEMNLGPEVWKENWGDVFPLDLEDDDAEEDEVNGEEDGYDYIGQLDNIQQNVDDGPIGENPLPLTRNSDVNAIKVSQNPYYEESLDPKNYKDLNSTAQARATTADHITKLENPYYEGI